MSPSETEVKIGIENPGSIQDLLSMKKAEGGKYWTGVVTFPASDINVVYHVTPNSRVLFAADAAYVGFAKNFYEELTAKHKGDHAVLEATYPNPQVFAHSVFSIVEGQLDPQESEGEKVVTRHIVQELMNLRDKPESELHVRKVGDIPPGKQKQATE